MEQSHLPNLGFLQSHLASLLKPLPWVRLEMPGNDPNVCKFSVSGVSGKIRNAFPRNPYGIPEESL